MPESKGRNKPVYIPPRSAQKAKGPNPRWYVPLMLGLMVVGLLWVVTYYVSGANQYPVPPLERWNLAVGFGLMLAGFLMTTGWR